MVEAWQQVVMEQAEMPFGVFYVCNNEESGFNNVYISQLLFRLENGTSHSYTGISLSAEQDFL
jgi:hypothetical protein